MSKKLILVGTAAAGLISPAAFAHVSVSSGPATANATQEVTFGVGHGCSGADTAKVRIQIPAAITSVRAVDSTFGKAVIEKDAAGLVKAVVWTKPEADVLAEDLNYYKLTLRLKTPDKPFSTIYFPVTQTCKSATGTTVVEWIGTPADAPPTTDAAAPEPAAALVVVPAHSPGWNKIVVSDAISNLKTYFGDAQIVWVGTAAYSANPTTAELIKTEPNTQALESIAAGATVWVRY